MQFTDKVATYPNRKKFTPVSGADNVYDVTDDGPVSQSGTPLNAATLNNLKAREVLKAEWIGSTLALTKVDADVEIG